MFDADHVRLGRIADKLVAVRAIPAASKAFGVETHGFKLEAPLPEAVVAEFEERHEVTLPQGYRLFVTQLGDGGAGPGHGLRRLPLSEPVKPDETSGRVGGLWLVVGLEWFGWRVDPDLVR